MPAQTSDASVFRTSSREACAVTLLAEAASHQTLSGRVVTHNVRSLGTSPPGNDLLAWRVCACAWVCAACINCVLYLQFRTNQMKNNSYNFGRPTCRCENNIKKDITELRCQNLDYIHTVFNRNQWLVVVYTVMNFRVPKMTRISWVVEWPGSFWRGILLQGVTSLITKELRHKEGLIFICKISVNHLSYLYHHGTNCYEQCPISKSPLPCIN